VKAWLLLLIASLASGQDFSQRGFLDTTANFYPQAAPGDSGKAVGEALFRYETFYKATPYLKLEGGIDARTDSHRQVEREAGLAWWDRNRQRPALAVRRLNATFSAGKLTVEAGKQFIRWGRTDILTPTDRFAPRDYLNVVENDFLAITAARLTYGSQSNSIELVYSPRLSPSRVPLINQRWAGPAAALAISEAGPDFPGGPQFGARWNHIGSAAEYALSFYDGYDHQPLYRAALPTVQRFYPQLRMYGGDVAIPLSLVTFKAEAAYFTSTNPQSDEYVLYVAQLERQAGEWFLVGGYTGQAVTLGRSTPGFSPERGFARALTAHAGYTIDTNRNLALEAAVRQNARGTWVKAEYSEAFGQHWRVTVGYVWIRGSETDFLGQYHRNSNAILDARYSF
jgi:hypothetical protein